MYLPSYFHGIPLQMANFVKEIDFYQNTQNLYNNTLSVPKRKTVDVYLWFLIFKDDKQGIWKQDVYQHVVYCRYVDTKNVACPIPF